MTRRVAGPPAALLAALAASGPAAAAPSIQVDLSTGAPGASTSFHPRIDYEATDASGQQRALRKHFLTFPAGTVYDSLGAGSCQASAAELEAQGLGACPADSKVGEGTLMVIATKPPASAAGPLATELTLFNARHPKDAPAAENALLVAVSAGSGVQAAFTVPVTGNLAVEEPPPACVVPAESPPCPSGEFTARAADYTIAEHSRTVAGQVHRLLTTPPSCPEVGRWTFDSLREYRDGGTALRAGATTPCTPGSAPRLKLAAAPSTVARCRATRFRFTATSGGGPVAGATVRFANRSAVTGSDGRASIAARLCRPGPRRATAKAGGFRKGVAAVRVVR